MLIQDILITPVSYQENAWATLSAELTIGECLDYIKNGKFKDQVNNLRHHLNQGDIDLYGEEKRRLPAVTFSASFFNKRSRSDIKTYNNLLVIDIDKLSSDRLLNLKRSFKEDHHILSFWESPSKAGLKGIIVMNFDKKFSNEDFNDMHYYAFKTAQKYFSEKYDVALDASGSDIPRLCFFSYDVDLHMRDNYLPFEINYDESEFKIAHALSKKSVPLYIAEASANKKYNPYLKNHPNRRFQINSVIKFLSKSGKSITQSYKQWYQIAFAIANTFTYDIGVKYYLSLCKLDGHKYNEKQSISMLNYCYENTEGKFTFATIIYFAKEVGYKERKEVPKVEDKS